MRNFLVCKKGRGTRREMLGMFAVTDKSQLVWESISLSATGVQHADRLLSGPAIRLDYVAGERVKAMTLSSKEQPGGIKLVLQADDLAGQDSEVDAAMHHRTAKAGMDAAHLDDRRGGH